MSLFTQKIKVKDLAACRVRNLAARSAKAFFVASVKRFGLRKKHLSAALQAWRIGERADLLLEAQFTAVVYFPFVD